jgi:hypothetical protein
LCQNAKKIKFALKKITVRKNDAEELRKEALLMLNLKNENLLGAR